MALRIVLPTEKTDGFALQLTEVTGGKVEAMPVGEKMFAKKI